MFMTSQHNSEKTPILGKIIILVGGLCFGFLVGRIFFVPFKASGHSMAPSVKAGDTMIILKHTTPEPGDIALIRHPSDDGKVLLRRVIAGGGTTVEVRNKILYLNDKKFSFPWKIQNRDRRNFPMHFTERDNMAAQKIAPHHYFLLGDNLDQGFDSRTFGTVHEDAVIGTLLYLF